jgi:RimJ/RimL family protein N-acetyltransferase
MLPRDVFPQSLETPRLRLRRPERREEALYARQALDAYATRTTPLTESQAVEFGAFMVEHWVRYGFGFLVVEVIENGRAATPVGHTGFKYVDAGPGRWAETYGAIELGYSFVPAARGRGYATESGRAALAAAFEAFDIPSIRARCNPDNPKSAAVLLRCGMTELESTERHRRFEIMNPQRPA